MVARDERVVMISFPLRPVYTQSLLYKQRRERKSEQVSFCQDFADGRKVEQRDMKFGVPLLNFSDFGCVNQAMWNVSFAL
jgi:hypothetical protein